jgi:hypothetical protein
MSAEVIEHAFEPFFTTKEISKGTGVGPVHGVRRSSPIGRDGADPQPADEGTMVQIYLPRASSAAMAGRGRHHWWKSPQDRLLELGYRGRRGDDTAAEPQRDTKAEAPVIRNSNELLDLVDERWPALSVAVQRDTNTVDVAFD